MRMRNGVGSDQQSHFVSKEECVAAFIYKCINLSWMYTYSFITIKITRLFFKDLIIVGDNLCSVHIVCEECICVDYV